MSKTGNTGILRTLEEPVIFSYHLAKTTLATTAHALLCPASAATVPGLRRVECMTVMALGSPIFSPGRAQLRSLAVFASWEDEGAIDSFLAQNALGRSLATGWHVRLEFLRRWGRVSEFEDLPANIEHADPTAPVVAVTLARLRLPEAVRFIRWGKPVENLVRSHPGATLALAAMRPPRTFSTFSVWRSEREMTDMVRGLGSSPGASAHSSAMAENNRKKFHHEFTTLRFRAVSEHGEWEGRRGIVSEA